MKPFIFFLIFLFSSILVKAASIAVSPQKISFAAEEGEVIERQIIVYNTNEEDTNFTVESENYPEFFEFSQKEGIIKAQSHIPVVIKLKPGLKTGKYQDAILIRFIPKNENKVNIYVGAAVKAEIEIKPSFPQKKDFTGPLITLGIVAVGLLLYAAFR